MIKIKNKKAASHIEVILSFVIFLGFLIFLLAMFNPFSSSTRGNNLDYVERAIRNSTETELEFVTISFDDATEDCIYLNYSLKSKIYAKNESFSEIRAKNENGMLYLEGGGRFFYLYSSPEFEELDVSIDECNKEIEGYRIGLYRNYSVISFDKLNLLTNEYKLNYPELKSKLRIKGEFAFGVRDTSGNEILLANNQGKNVYARDVPIQLVYKDGTLKYAIMNIQTWV
ncbi:MAG: hypothetical protein NT076_01195 [Candidatus Pacearchaeota archaeon]|nr:hypothetical protein [Candidatus Pacearchaeota archaeon]